MLRRKRQDRTVRLLCPCSLKDSGRTAGSAGDFECVTDRCRVPCRSLEEAAEYISDGLGDTWAAISSTIDGRRHELDSVLEQLVAIAASDGNDGAARRPIRTLLVSESEEARRQLYEGIAGDSRFVLVGEAGSPQEAVALAAGDLPDLVVLHLVRLDSQSLTRLGDLQHWSPRTALVLVYGIDVSRAADLVVTSRLGDDWPFAEFSSAGARGSSGAGAGGGVSGGGPPSVQARQAGPGVLPPRRSIIHEAMRQIGVPMRRKQ